MVNEKRLIDTNAFLRETFFQEGIYPHGQLKREIESTPTVDAVEVVRCKDCVHMKVKFNARFCEVWCMFNGMGDEGFCNYGERKE